MNFGEKEMDCGKSIFWFEELGAKENDLVGKKCANLGIMRSAGLPTPPGFAISLGVYREFVRETGALDEISRLGASLGKLKGRGITVCQDASRRIQAILEGKKIPLRMRKMISAYYGELCARVGIDRVAVSVRSAGTESRPGMFDTYLNVRGIEEVLDKVKKVWASAYTARAIAFRVAKDMPLIGDELGVAIPKMVNARSSGIAFTVDPITGDHSKVIIESNWGLGEGVVSGAENVDRFAVDKATMDVVERIVGRKTRQVRSSENGVAWSEVPPAKQSHASLDDHEIEEIARLAKSLEAHIGFPQDIEWAIDSNLPFPGSVFLLQTRPVKVLEIKPPSTTDRIAELLSKSLGGIR
jgi:pyruvate,water dikinase